ncbi:hypothetical protein KRX54_05100 [Actinomycetaceae bacterium TAE3-ERU4]|nr:hypothetical protein [Actinomycetaceae bacterium TAE3-ERU4]
MSNFDDETTNLYFDEATAMSLLGSLQDMFESASGTFPLGTFAKINRDQALDLIAQIREALPRDVQNADGIVSEANEVLARADEESQARLSDATAEAKRITEQSQMEANTMVEDAKVQAEQISSAAQEEAKRHLAGANEQAQQILEDARAQAERLISAEEVLQEANSRAQQVIKQAEHEANKLTVDANQYARHQMDELVKRASEVAKIAAGGRDAIDARLSHLADND